MSTSSRAMSSCPHTYCPQYTGDGQAGLLYIFSPLSQFAVFWTIESKYVVPRARATPTCPSHPTNAHPRSLRQPAASDSQRCTVRGRDRADACALVLPSGGQMSVAAVVHPAQPR